MPFRFTLKAVLRLRETLEQAELDRLRRIAADIVRARGAITSLDTDFDLQRRRMLDEARQGITGAEWRFEALREDSYQERRRRLVQEVNALEAARVECQKRYVGARQKREILSHLRERQLLAYDLEVSRTEQQQLDALFLLRRRSDDSETR